MLKLYHHPQSTFSRRVRIALLEKQIPATLVEIDLVAREHRGPAYLALNPYGRVPALADDGFVVYESTAILEYLELICPRPPLVPPDPQGRARVAMHMKLCDLQMARPAGAILVPRRFLPRDRWDLAAMAQARKDIEKHLGILEMQLQGVTFLTGEQYTLAEVCYTPFVEFLPLMEIQPPPAVAAWVARLLERPSAQRTRPSR